MIRFEHITAKKTHILVILFIAFLPPEPTYSIHAADNPTTEEKESLAKTKKQSSSIDDKQYKIVFTEKSEWQHSQFDIGKLDAYFVTTSRHNRIACLYVNCTPNPKYYILFSHGNAVDLGSLNSIRDSFVFFQHRTYSRSNG